MFLAAAGGAGPEQEEGSREALALGLFQEPGVERVARAYYARCVLGHSQAAVGLGEVALTLSELAFIAETVCAVL